VVSATPWPIYPLLVSVYICKYIYIRFVNIFILGRLAHH
jgi:hypothetical protein